MFGGFKKKVDYEKIFASTSDTHNCLYSDRTKTSTILADEAFIDAWLGSRNVSAVTGVIRAEALKGDVPSLKQLIWVSDLYFKNAESMTSDRSQQTKIKVSALKERIMLCDKVIGLGVKDQAYVAMVSSANLYGILAPLSKDVSDEGTRAALAGIVKYANQFLESGYDDKELISDAKGLIAQYGPIAKLTAAMNK